MAQHERHPNITMACDIAFQGRHDEGVLERTNLILYRDFKKNIDAWRNERVKGFVEDKAGCDRVMVWKNGFSFMLPWRDFVNPGCEFSSFPHRKVVDFLISANELTVRVTTKGIALVNSSRGSFTTFEFGETDLTTDGCDQTAGVYCDPMEGKSLMTKLSAAAEFVDMIDMKLSDFGALTPTKAS